MLRFFIYLLLFFSLLSCDRIKVEANSAKAHLVTQIATKGTGSGNVYRIYLNGLDSYETEGIEVSGTYMDHQSGSPLTPCSVDEDYKYAEDDPSCGLRAKDGMYKIHIVYPAVEMEEIPVAYSGGKDINGYLINRVTADDDVEIYLSEPADVSLSGVYLSDADGAQYIYDAKEMPLKQPRSKISVNFECGSNIASTTLRKVLFKNIIQKGYYRPLDGIYYFLNDGSAHDDIEDVLLFEGEEEIRSGENKVLPETFILSMNYGETDSQKNPKWPLPSFVFSTGAEGSEEEVTFIVALGWQFEQQKEYIFNIIMNSMYVDITVEVDDWDCKTVGQGNVTLLRKWKLVYSGDDWTVVGDITGTI